MAEPEDLPEQWSVFSKQSGPVHRVFRGLLRHRQVDALDTIIGYLNHPHRAHDRLGAVAVLPTGTGKSGIAVLLPYLLGSLRVLVVTPSLTITQQLNSDFSSASNQPKRRAYIIERGIFRHEHVQRVLPHPGVATNIADLVNLTARMDGRSCIIIANAQKLPPRALAEIPENKFDLVIVDEAHHYPSEIWSNIVHRFRQHAKVVFLTATPRNPLPEDWNICYNLRFGDAVNEGIIRNLLFANLPVQPNVDPNTAIIQQMIQLLDEHGTIVVDGVRRSYQGLILTGKRTEDADQIANLFNAIDNRFHACAYHTKLENSENVKNEFVAGNRRILVVVGSLLEGFNHELVSVVGICRPVGTGVIAFTQFVGRAVRHVENEPQAFNASLVSHVSYSQFQNHYNLVNDVAFEPVIEF